MSNPFGTVSSALEVQLTEQYAVQDGLFAEPALQAAGSAGY